MTKPSEEQMFGSEYLLFAQATQGKDCSQWLQPFSMQTALSRRLEGGTAWEEPWEQFHCFEDGVFYI